MKPLKKVLSTITGLFLVLALILFALADGPLIPNLYGIPALINLVIAVVWKIVTVLLADKSARFFLNASLLEPT